MSRSRKQKSTNPNSLLPTNASEIFQKVSSKFNQIEEGEIKPIDVDVAVAVAAARAAFVEYGRFRDAIGLELPKISLIELDQLENYALATLFMHVTYQAVQNDNTQETHNLEQQASNLRQDLLIAAEALAHRGLLARALVAEVRNHDETPTLAQDLMTLSEMFLTDWPKIAGKTAIEQQEAERAVQLGSELLIRDTAKQLATTGGDLDRQRKQAFALLARTYNTLRRALSYLRWNEGDAESLAPNVLQKKRARKSGEVKEVIEETLEV